VQESGRRAGEHFGDGAAETADDAVLFDGEHVPRPSRCAKDQMLIDWLERGELDDGAGDAIGAQRPGCIQHFGRDETARQQRHVPSYDRLPPPHNLAPSFMPRGRVRPMANY